MPIDNGGWEPVAPSALPFDAGYTVPHALEVDEIRGIVGAFRKGAERALAAGFQLVEIHAAHGYLIHEFLSPLCNTRDDEYGGTFDKRVRFALEVAKAIREVWPCDLASILPRVGNGLGGGRMGPGTNNRVEQTVEAAGCRSD